MIVVQVKDILNTWTSRVDENTAHTVSVSTLFLQ